MVFVGNGFLVYLFGCWWVLVGGLYFFAGLLVAVVGVCDCGWVCGLRVGFVWYCCCVGLTAGLLFVVDWQVLLV